MTSEPSSSILGESSNAPHGYTMRPGGESFSSELLQCTISSPMKEQDGTKDAYVSYLITTHSNFPAFQKPVSTVRRRFTDFVFLYKAVCKDFPATAVPPLPDKQRMEYVRGDRFGSEFTSRRAKSLERFLVRLSLHPILRRAPILHSFLESTEWNSTMRSVATRSSFSEPSASMFDSLTDTVMHAFSKVSRPDQQFVEVRENSDKLDEDLGQIEKLVARVARREADIEADLKDLADQFRKLITMEPGVETAARAFATSVDDTASRLKTLHHYTDLEYLGSLRDMQAYSLALKGLLKAREQKQIDFEQLSMYLERSTTERENLGSGHAHSSLGGALNLGGATGFIRSKIEDARGVDHEQARRERQRKLELRIEELVAAVDSARSTASLFDEEVVREVADFERIKRIELKKHFAGFTDVHVEFYTHVEDIWEQYIAEMEAEEAKASPPGRE